MSWLLFAFLFTTNGHAREVGQIYVDPNYLKFGCTESMVWRTGARCQFSFVSQSGSEAPLGRVVYVPRYFEFTKYFVYISSLARQTDRLLVVNLDQVERVATVESSIRHDVMKYAVAVSEDPRGSLKQDLLRQKKQVWDPDTARILHY